MTATFKRLPDTIEIGSLRIAPRIEVVIDITWEGKHVSLGGAKLEIVKTLIGEPRTFFTRLELAEIIGSRARDKENVVEVHLCNIRAILPGVPIQFVRGKGYRWL